MRLLLAEDDKLIGETLVDGLTEGGFLVEWLRDGQQALSALRSEQSFDIAILDIGLPRLSGLEVLHAVREQGSALPILLLTARDSINDRVLGLNEGADDYMIKPFALSELTARLHALLRRGHRAVTNVLTWQDFKLHVSDQKLEQSGKEVSLSAAEFRLVHILMANQSHYLSRSQLEDKMYGWQTEIESNALDVHLSNIRKKLGANSIINARNLGWRLSQSSTNEL